MIQLGRRLIAFNAPKLLTQKEHDAFDTYLKHKWESEDEKAEWITTIKVKEQLEELEKNGCDLSVLNELKGFYKDRLEDKKCFIEFD